MCNKEPKDNPAKRKGYFSLFLICNIIAFPSALFLLQLILPVQIDVELGVATFIGSNMIFAIVLLVLEYGDS